MNRYFHFTMGPVQGFVSQARRTKDFWAGSFLLSYLAGVAMVATQKLGGEIVFPLPDDEYLLWIQKGKGVNHPPRQGNIPNRFKAKIGEGFEPKKVVEALSTAWIALCEHVWEKDLSHLNGTKTREIWERQTGGFWEISWAISEDETESNLLDRRKNWRTHYPKPEAGQKCSIMEGFGELSGEEAAQNQAQKEFWKRLRETKKDFDLDIKKGEHLCALAFIKRRFTRYFEDFSVDIDGLFTAYGWKLESNVPSAALLAAAPWLANAIQKAPTEKIKSLIEASKAVSDKGAAMVKLKCLKDARANKRDIPEEVFRLDGMTLFDSFLDNENLYEKNAANLMKQALKDVRNSLENNKTPSPYYAILLMDGDQLGAQMSDGAKQKPISNALNSFTKRVEKIVYEHSGFLIYAGGDDVLAVLPLEYALSCAAALRQTYNEAFEGEAKKVGVETSISAAVTFAHVKTPLHSVLAASHRLLDNIAKDGAGRDALAIQIVKSGGISNTWAQPWDIALQDGIVELERLAIAYAKQTESGQFSSGFFYRIREIMDVASTIGSDDDRIELLAAEYRTGTNLKQTDAKRVIEPLLIQCTPTIRDPKKPKSEWEKKEIKTDGALIVRFLVQKGVEW